ncbi:choice-of-anchor P family protein [uncultured Friedmanniella sp.]|uniref:choice-of-anchor P family protein n=1 Tax=uncultured Friedmanniella sp. TaxID=335381 RepID=UPI0035CA4566
MSTSPTRRILAVTSASTVAAALAMTMPLPAQAATTTYDAFSGSAYVSVVTLGPITSGASAVSSVCTTNKDLTRTNTVAKLSVPLLGNVGAGNTQVTTSGSGSSGATTATTTIAGTSLLGGLVSASAITSSAKVSHTGDTYTNTASSTFTGLKIAGRSVTVKPTGVTTVSIPGIASVVLNNQKVASAAGNHTLGVIAMRVNVLKGNPLGLASGTVIVGVANAGLRDTIFHKPAASAYGTQIDVAGVVSAGKTASVGLPCGGLTDVTKSSNLAGVDVPGVLKVGALTTKVSSTDTASSTTANASAEIGATSLLGGVISVDAITAASSSTRKGTKVTTTSEGTQVLGLKINGVDQTTADVAENSTIDIDGVGTLYLRRAVRSGSSLQVYALQLKLDTAQLGLAAGTTLTVGSAYAAVTAY